MLLPLALSSALLGRLGRELPTRDAFANSRWRSTLLNEEAGLSSAGLAAVWLSASV
jgi:hypothetical protein